MPAITLKGRPEDIVQFLNGLTGRRNGRGDSSPPTRAGHSEEEAALEALMMADVDVSDIESEGGKVTVFAPQTEYYKAKQALLDAFEGVDFEVDEIQFIPQTSVSLGEEEQVAFDNLVDMLEYLEDVQNVYHNVG